VTHGWLLYGNGVYSDQPTGRELTSGQFHPRSFLKFKISSLSCCSYQDKRPTRTINAEKGRVGGSGTRAFGANGRHGGTQLDSSNSNARHRKANPVDYGWGELHFEGEQSWRRAFLVQLEETILDDSAWDSGHVTLETCRLHIVRSLIMHRTLRYHTKFRGCRRGSSRPSSPNPGHQTAPFRPHDVIASSHVDGSSPKSQYNLLKTTFMCCARGAAG